MKRIKLLLKEDYGFVTNIPKSSALPAKLRMLKTKYMTLNTTDEFTIILNDIDEFTGTVNIKTYKKGQGSQTFNIELEDDPIIVLNDYDDEEERHIFEKVYNKACNYKINPKIKVGGVYKFEQGDKKLWFLAIVRKVDSSVILFDDLIWDRYDRPLLLDNGFSLDNKRMIAEYKDWFVTELYNLKEDK